MQAKGNRTMDDLFSHLQSPPMGEAEAAYLESLSRINAHDEDEVADAISRISALEFDAGNVRIAATIDWLMTRAR